MFPRFQTSISAQEKIAAILRLAKALLTELQMTF
jgi:hypothetical protein